MSTATITEGAAQDLFRKGRAFFEGTHGLVTRYALYEWYPTLGHYERVADGLRLRHRIGARWDGTLKRFVACHCSHCQKYPEVVAAVEIAREL